MPTPIVECIANFSEARQPEVVEAIVQAVLSVPETTVLDRHSDLDHNRTVLTFVGPPAAVEEAAFQSIAKAAELIDLDQHTGEHPRIGAADVVPFVPIRDISMPECVLIARRLGERVGSQLDIPVYLYEEAATRPERKNLENIRRGQYETLKAEIGTLPERDPDFGPKRVGPAGAVVIGARPPLIAFNVYLTTSDVSIAKKIARAVRNSSGGLRFVKALGLLVEGRAQVSMNLTNFHQTPLDRVVDLIRREASRYGVAVHHSELVGLIPQQALIDTARWHLQLDQFEPDQVLETRLAVVQRQEAASASQDFLDALAAGTPAPGGGSAAAYTGAAGAALVAMVARLTLGKKKYAAVEQQMYALLAETEDLRAALTAAIEKDARAFEAVMQAFKLPRDTDEEAAQRQSAIDQATMVAAEVPLETARMAVRIIQLAAEAAELGNLNAISDGATGAALAHASLTGAGYNVRINVASLSNPNQGAETRHRPAGSRSPGCRSRKPCAPGDGRTGGRRTLKFDSIWSSIQPLIRLLLVSAVLNLTASCSPAGADPELPTPTMASGTSIKFVDMPLDASNDLTSEPTGISTPKVPSAAVTSAEPAKTAQLEPSQLQPSSTLQPELSPKIPCAEDLCVYSAVLYLQRPIDPAENDAVDATYRFGSTQSGRRDPHHGVEFLNGFGTPVLAAADGRVVVAGGDLDPISPHGDWPILFYGPYSNFYGSLVVIEHALPEAVETAFPDLEGPLYTLYGHLSEISVEVGQQVSAGEQIGRVGMAGIATGSHLHFEVRLGENSYAASSNPELWLQPHSRRNGRSERRPRRALPGRLWQFHRDGKHRAAAPPEWTGRGKRFRNRRPHLRGERLAEPTTVWGELRAGRPASRSLSGFLPYERLQERTGADLSWPADSYNGENPVARSC